MKTTRESWCRLALVVGLCVLSTPGCSDQESKPRVGGHTNWLECERLADCDHPDVVACAGGYCVDADGQRLERVASTSDSAVDGSAGTVGSPGGSAAIADGGSQPSAAGRGGSGTQPDASAGGSTAGASGAPADGGSAAGAGAGGADAGQDVVRIPQCPGSTVERCASEACTADFTCLTCPAGQVCLQVELSCGPAGGSTTQCIDDPCRGSTLDCACAAPVCAALEPAPGGWTCGAFTQDSFLVGPDRAPFLACSGGGICASPDTRIATPRGEVAIAELREGDLVYTRDDDGVRVVPLIAVARTPVYDHHVLRVTLDGGGTLEVSGPHPTADGGRLDELAVGASLDGRKVLALERIAYRHPYTHDILPASASGTYLANGVWLGSTLAAASGESGSK